MCTKDVEGWGANPSTGSGSAEPIFCDHCHKQIDGIYMFAMGGVFCCNTCVETYVRQREVGRPSTPLRPLDKLGAQGRSG